MYKDILVAILEDDLFSRNWMALMLVRDWRTRLIGEFATPIELCTFIKSNPQTFDVLVLDVDIFGEVFSIDEICEQLAGLSHPVNILLTGVQPKAHVLRHMMDERIFGYVLKQEVGYSLGWVITFVYEKECVLTPGTLALAHHMNLDLPKEKIILDGRKNIPGFTDHEAEVARMAIVFSLGRRDLADELKISEQWGYGLVSELYKKLGLSEILSGEEDLFSYIGENPIIRRHFEEIIEQLGTSKKARDLETLAYHVLTMPEIVP